MSDRWYVKTSYPNDSIVAVFDTEDEAQEWAVARNKAYQAEKYYIEAHDPAKVWDVDIIEFLMKYREEKKKIDND